MLRKIVESLGKKIIFTGSKEKVQIIMDKLQDYEEDHGFPYQGYFSSKKGSGFAITVEDETEYEKNKEWMDKIIK